MICLNFELYMNLFEFNLVNEFLLIVIGNDVWQDDGLGWVFGQVMEVDEDFWGMVVYCYQLQVEDVLLIVDYGIVFFVDVCWGELLMGFEFILFKVDVNFGFIMYQLLLVIVLVLLK